MTITNTRYTISLFIFRRDLRINDNTGLVQALNCSEQVLPCFIFDPRQIQPHPYQSKPALRFMRESIADLRNSLQALGSDLAVYEGLPVDVLKRLVAKFGIQAVFVNRDYTPFSRKRDKEIVEFCQSVGIGFHISADYLLTEPEHGLKSDGTPYKVFTAFYNNARRLPVALPVAIENPSFLLDTEMVVNNTILNMPYEVDNQRLPGGRCEAQVILSQLNNKADYTATRDYPALDATSKLSAHLKFGTCSVREAYYGIIQQLGEDHPLLRQLYWRDFFSHVGFYFPYVFGKAFNRRYDNLLWDNNLEYFQRWCDGNTGFPIVDAGMRELNATGFMHNRVRMIVASFLTKDLHISWRWGERYFAQHLVDYDPAVNNGNWQWAASTGCDSQPYFRVFNPWTQQQKFDPECQYIKYWVPEVKQIEAKILHNWRNKYSGSVYLQPIVEHARESQSAKERYRQLD